MNTNIISNFSILANSDTTYLDSAATTLKPQAVINAVSDYYSNYPANIHRGLYSISGRATQEYENSRTKVQNLLNAAKSDEIIFTRGTTESINLLAYCLGNIEIQRGNSIVTTIFEHHSNFVPWQQRAKRNGAKFEVVGQKNILDDISQKVNASTKIFACTYTSNVLGATYNIDEVIKAVRTRNPKTLIIVDAAQAIAHEVIDVQKLGADAIAFSGHKMCGPTGLGVLWARKGLLEKMPPFLFGGDMVETVSIDTTTFAASPQKFEAGTPPIAEVIGMGAAIDFLNSVTMKSIYEQTQSITAHAYLRIRKEFPEDITFLHESAKNVGMILPALEESFSTGILSFTLKDIHAHDVAQILADENICVRAGHHCAMPLHTALGIPASVRTSFHFYNTEEDVEKLILGLKNVKKVFNRS